MIIGSVGHHAGTNGELHLLLSVLKLQGGIGVEVLGYASQCEDCQKRHQNIFFHIKLCRFNVVNVITHCWELVTQTLQGGNGIGNDDIGL